MSRVEVIVATMHQKDFSLFEEMNIQTDVIFCNQCDENKFEETVINGCRIRMISTTTRGVGINRNLGMQLSDAEICLLADDDVVYVEGYEKIICDVFDKYQAPVVFFNVDGCYNKAKKNHFTNRSVATYRMAYKNKEIKKIGICFSDAFGGGTMYSCGEDSLFSRTLGKFKIKRLMAADQIGVNTHKESTWFKGYTEKYVFDKGAYCKAANPKIWNILKYYYIFQEYKKIKMPLWKIVKLYNNGAKAYKSSLSYDEFYQSEKEKKCKH